MKGFRGFTIWMTRRIDLGRATRVLDAQNHDHSTDSDCGLSIPGNRILFVASETHESSP